MRLLFLRKCVSVCIPALLNVLPAVLVPLITPTTSAAADQILEVYNPAGVRQDGIYVDKLLKQVMKATGKTRPPLAAVFPEGRAEKVTIKKDASEEINELFYKRGWADGLPIVPPTAERVKEMLTGTDLPPDRVIAAVPPKGGQATVEKIAVNAVMAGCRPEYMPVLIAAVQAVAEPGFNLSEVATSTSHDAPLIIVNGPIAKQLEISGGSNALGRGWRANATIGRALELIINNVGGSWPGINDMSPLGSTMEFANCIAENQEASPWKPLHVEFGHSEGSNAVTVIASESFQTVVGLGLTSKQFLDLLGDRLVGLNTGYMPALLIILNVDSADILKGDGFTKEAVKKHIAERARLPFSEYKKRYLSVQDRGARVPEAVRETTDPNAMTGSPIIDQFLILVAGGPPGEKTVIVPIWPGSKPISKEIKVPGNWEEVLKKARR
jgi:hypothetical protein